MNDSPLISVNELLHRVMKTFSACAIAVSSSVKPMRGERSTLHRISPAQAMLIWRLTYLVLLMHERAVIRCPKWACSARRSAILA